MCNERLKQLAAEFPPEAPVLEKRLCPEFDRGPLHLARSIMTAMWILPPPMART